MLKNMKIGHRMYFSAAIIFLTFAFGIYIFKNSLSETDTAYKKLLDQEIYISEEAQNISKLFEKFSKSWGIRVSQTVSRSWLGFTAVIIDLDQSTCFANNFEGATTDLTQEVSNGSFGIFQDNKSEENKPKAARSDEVSIYFRIKIPEEMPENQKSRFFEKSAAGKPCNQRYVRWLKSDSVYESDK